MSANRLFGFTGCKGTTKFADVQENGDFFSRFAGYRTFMRAMGYWVKGGISLLIL